MTNSIIFNLNENDILIDNIINELSLNKHTIEKGKVNIQVFKDGESCVNYETSIRGKRVFLLTSPNNPLKIMQLMLAIDAAKKSSASEIIPIMPYFPYARQDKRDQYRGPIGVKVLAKTFEMLGATSFVTVDLHSNQIEGFFDVPLIHIRGKYLFADFLVKNSTINTVFCSPDAGGVKRVKKIRDLISERYKGTSIQYVTIDKTRSGANKISEMSIIGNVKDASVIIIDDLCDTGGTLIKASDTLIKAGAKSVKVLVTHAVMSGSACENIADSKIEKFICSDTLETKDFKLEMPGKMEVISIDKEIAMTIIGINTSSSVISAR